MSDDVPVRNYVPRSAIPRTSTNVDPDLMYTTLLSISEGDPGDPDPLNRLDWLDPLDPNFLRAINQTKTIGAPHVYQGEPITTIAKTYYGKTSPWSLIVVFNGFLHPDEIPRGIEIDLPDVEGFLAAYRAAQSSARQILVF